MPVLIYWVDKILQTMTELSFNGGFWFLGLLITMQRELFDKSGDLLWIESVAAYKLN